MSYKDPEKQREYQRKWRQERRDSWFKDKECISCGSTDNLELDHKDPSTKIDHKIWSWREERRNKELEKCQVLCKDCHENKTVEERIIMPDHGTLDRYKHKLLPCRCASCRKANAEYEANRRAYSNNWENAALAPRSSGFKSL